MQPCLQVFCGILGRVWQFSDILADAKGIQAHVCHNDDGDMHDTALHQTQQCREQTQRQHNSEQQRQPPPLQQQHQQQHQDVEQEKLAAPQQLRHPRSQRASVCHQVILGDLNTMANGIARLSPNYCCDDLRWGSLGMSEARYWQRHVLSCTGGCVGMEHIWMLV